MARNIPKAVARALPGVAHELCHFHYLREAAKPIYEADRHAKKELKKRVRGIRPIERRAEKVAETAEDDDGSGDRAGLLRRGCARPDRRWAAAAGGRGAEVARSAEPDRRQLGPVTALAGDLPGGLNRLRQLLRPGWRRRPPCGPRCGRRTGGSSAWPVTSRTRTGRRRRWCGDGWCNCWGGCAGGDDDGRAVGGRGFEAVPEGDAELLAGLVSMLRRGRPAADEQRPGAHLRQPSLPRTSIQWSAAGVAGSGRDGLRRVISGLATRLRPDEGLVLRPGYVEDWQDLRAKLDQRREARRKRRRFRHDPAAYLAKLEQQCLQ